MARTASQVGKSNVNRSKAHERRVAKLLGEWTGQEFRRRRVTGRDTATRMVELAADVIPLEGEFKFSVEAKCGQGFSLGALMATPTSCLITKWWHQTCFDAQLITADLGRPVHPLLFFKPIPAQDWVAVSARLFGSGEQGLRPRPALNVTDTTRPWFQHLWFDGYQLTGPVQGDVSHTKVKRLVSVVLDPMVICHWRTFAEAVDPASAYV